MKDCHSLQGRSQDFFRGRVALCQTEGTDQVVISTSGSDLLVHQWTCSDVS